MHHYVEGKGFTVEEAEKAFAEHIAKKKDAAGKSNQ